MFPILTSAELPVLGADAERRELDFKIGVNPNAALELAKDVAAMANTIGGTVIVGAQTSGPVLAGYPGIPLLIAEQVAEAYDKATKDRCRPSPIVSCAILSMPSGTTAVLAVNVWASALAPVGVQLKRDETRSYEGDVWLFPFRVGSHTRFLQPDQFGTLENVTARRGAALLQAIPNSERGHVILQSVTTDQRMTMASHATIPARLDVIDPATNSAAFTILEGNSALVLPLDWIDTAWRAVEGTNARWIVALKGALHHDGNGRWQLLTKFRLS